MQGVCVRELGGIEVVTQLERLCAHQCGVHLDEVLDEDVEVGLHRAKLLAVRKEVSHRQQAHALHPRQGLLCIPRSALGRVLLDLLEMIAARHEVLVNAARIAVGIL